MLTKDAIRRLHRERLQPVPTDDQRTIEYLRLALSVANAEIARLRAMLNAK